MKQPDVSGVISGSQVDSLCRVAEVRRILMSMKAALPVDSRNCVAVTSTYPEEGKTLLSALLAAAVSDCSDKRVLVVDLNWKNPGLHKSFNLERDFELNTFLDGNNPQAHVKATMFSRVDVLTAPSRAQLAGQRNLSFLALSIVEKIKDLYDFVLLDTASVFPPNRNMVDPVVVSTTCDGVIMTVLAAVTPRNLVRRAVVNMEVSGATVLGIVMNQWRNMESSCRF